MSMVKATLLDDPMPMFEITLAQMVYETATVVVAAETIEDAKALALAQANEGAVTWHFVEAPDPCYVISASEVKVEGEDRRLPIRPNQGRLKNG